MSQRQYLLCGLYSFYFKRVPYGSPRFARGCSARRTLCSGLASAKRPMNPLRELRVSKRPPCDAVRIWKLPGEPPAVSNFCGSTLGARALLQSLPDHRSARASQAFPSSCSSRSLRSKRKPAKASAAWPVAGPLCARKDVR